MAEAIESEAPQLTDVDDSHTFVLGTLGDAVWSGSVDDLESAIRSTDPSLRKDAIGIFGELGDLNAIYQALSKDADEDVRKFAVKTIGRLRSSGTGIDSAGIAVLQTAALDASPEVRHAASALVVSLGETPWPGGIDGLRQTVKHDNPNLRSAAVNAFGYLGKAIQPEDVSLLKEAVSDPIHVVRWTAAQMLAALGDLAWGNVPELAKMAIGKDVYLRRAAVVSLASFAKTDAGLALTVLHNSIVDEDPEVRSAVIKGLSSMTPLPSEMVDTICSCLVYDPDPRVRHVAALGLNDLSDSIVPPAQGQVRWALREGLQDTSSEVRSAVANVVAALGLKPYANGFDDIREALERGELYDRRAAVIALRSLHGTQVDDTHEDWIDLALADPDPFVRWATSDLVESFPVKHWTAAEMRAAYEDADTWVRQGAVGSLGRLGDDIQEEDLDVMLRAIATDTDPGVRRIVAYSLGILGSDRIGTRGQTALQQALKDDSWLVVQEAAKALVKAGDVNGPGMVVIDRRTGAMTSVHPQA